MSLISLLRDWKLHDPKPAAASQPAPRVSAIPALTIHIPMRRGVVAPAAPAVQPVTPEPTHLNIFLTTFQYALRLLPSIVTGIETIIGDAESGATKKKMATDALGEALAGATAVTSGTDATLATLASTTVLGIINATDAISNAVTTTKANGTYQAATAAAAATQAAVSAANSAATTAAAVAAAESSSSTASSTPSATSTTASSTPATPSNTASPAS